MFRDTQEALKRLQAQLLAEEAEEETEEDLEEEEEEELTDEDMEQIRQLLKEPPAEYRNYANHYRAYNSDNTDTDPEEYSRALQEEAPGSRVGITVLAVLMVLGIVVLVAWWLASYGGLL